MTKLQLKIILGVKKLPRFDEMMDRDGWIERHKDISLSICHLSFY